MRKEYVILITGYGKKARYTLKERMSKGYLNIGLITSKSLDKVKAYAFENNMEVVAIGDIYQVA